MLTILLICLLVCRLDVYFDLNQDIINNNESDSIDHDSIDCKYYDEQSMISSFSSFKNPIAISINIQSLSSKFENFSDMISNFEQNNLFFDVIAIQETWDIKNVNSLTLPSFHEFISKTRSSSRGGGVGFYIKRDLKFKIIKDFLSLMNASLNRYVSRWNFPIIILLCLFLSIDLLPITSYPCPNIMKSFWKLSKICFLTSLE